ncbi:hypothetical protein V8C44DRAFT_340199 [Trichoderma aethiopicum]
MRASLSLPLFGDYFFVFLYLALPTPARLLWIVVVGGRFTRSMLLLHSQILSLDTLEDLAALCHLAITSEIQGRQLPQGRPNPNCKVLWHAAADVAITRHLFFQHLNTTWIP